MIICNIQGGLGNQMFQYAMGRSLSFEIQAEVKFSVDSFSQYQSHNEFELNRVFGIGVPLATKRELRKVLGAFSAHPSIRRILSQKPFQIFRDSNFIVESTADFHAVIESSLMQDFYLHGYWQSEKYFARFSDHIRDEFSFLGSSDPRSIKLLDQIRSSEAVSIHVRRGDYISNPKALATHGVCEIDYYRRAIDYIKDVVKDPRFYIFTDDVQWVKVELCSLHPGMVVIDHNRGDDSYNDMHLMSSCEHHIIANSSFSWWGAWLNPSERKIVIAPKRWFANAKMPSNLLPETWMRF